MACSNNGTGTCPPRPKAGLRALHRGLTLSRMDMPAPRRHRERALNLPGAVVGVLVALTAVHAVRMLVLSDETDVDLILALSAVPARWTVALDPARAAEVVAAAGRAGALAAHVLADGPHAWTAVTYAFLHGSWAHLVVNSVWLAAFGAPVATRLGPARFLVLALACALGGAGAHALMHPLSVVPMLGASAVASGLMGAAARFVFTPARAPGWPGEPARRPPLEPLSALLSNRRAALFLGLWFATNLAFGVLAAPLGVVEAGIAWEAHIGGFLAGLFLMPALDPPPGAAGPHPDPGLS